ncbi:glycoside hydrolase family 76 protein [Arthrobacter mobilis]|uniref:Glycosyl hydrolase n=1 Tax=Arthrobacter mobilis TaxID=2724944 RepID=A0A7X6QM51_9MICC|nr:glycoside hydrolase family 76 protein [Arthrobacter mobilis]NKX56432.1 glycosyl hydrolase [Arthrobacter mobilis]
MSTPAQERAVRLAGGRADEAAAAVVGRFGCRLLGLPGTHLGAARSPRRAPLYLGRPWHYWWQAHYIDCLVDAGRRELVRGLHYDGGYGRSAGALAARVLGTVRLRNGLRFPNDYYDDMAWLALAAHRLEGLAAAAGKPRRRPQRAAAALLPQLESAHTPDLGGGLFWSTRRDFKNTPATGPAALCFARTGRTARARELLDWLDAHLYDAGRRLYLDGIRSTGGRQVLVADLYTYNQGPVLGALLELGTPADLRRAADLVHGVAAGLTRQHRDGPVLRVHGTGDGGLFTGILARYLAMAAAAQDLPAEVRQLAGTLVARTARAFWEGRRLQAHRDGEALVFPADPAVPARESYPPGSTVELSTQLQAWMTLEAAAAVQPELGNGPVP